MFKEEVATNKKTNNKNNKLLPIFLWIIAFITTFVVIASICIYTTFSMILKGPSITARNEMVVKLYETNRLNVAKIYLSDTTVQTILNEYSLEQQPNITNITDITNIKNEVISDNSVN